MTQSKDMPQEHSDEVLEGICDKVDAIIRTLPYPEPTDVDSETLRYLRQCRGNSGIGIGVVENGSKIGVVVYAVTEDDRKRFENAIGDELDGVPIYYSVIGIISAGPAFE